MNDRKLPDETIPARIVIERREVHDSHFDLFVALRRIWRRRWLVGWVTAVSTLGAALLAFSLPPRFTATAVLLPVETESLSSSIPSSLLGLAGLAGIDTGGDSTGQEAVMTLRSRRFLYAFIEKHSARQQLFESRWDAERKQWRASSAGLAAAFDWLSSVGAPPDLPRGSADNGPSSWEAYERFRELLNVSQDRQTREVRVSLEWFDPVVAAQWVNALVADLDQEMRQTAVTQSTNRLSFLEKKLAEEGLVSLREAMSSLMENELTRIMLASVQGDYSLRVIDPAVAPERKSGPRRLSILLVGAAFGLFVAVVAVELSERRRLPRGAD